MENLVVANQLYRGIQYCFGFRITLDDKKSSSKVAGVGGELQSMSEKKPVTNL